MPFGALDVFGALGAFAFGAFGAVGHAAGLNRLGGGAMSSQA